jgi:hypothetical protein
VGHTRHGFIILEMLIMFWAVACLGAVLAKAVLPFIVHNCQKAFMMVNIITAALDSLTEGTEQD